MPQVRHFDDLASAEMAIAKHRNPLIYCDSNIRTKTALVRLRQKGAGEREQGPKWA
jgi:hypothetical protein